MTSKLSWSAAGLFVGAIVSASPRIRTSSTLLERMPLFPNRLEENHSVALTDGGVEAFGRLHRPLAHSHFLPTPRCEDDLPAVVQGPQTARSRKER